MIHMRYPETTSQDPKLMCRIHCNEKDVGFTSFEMVHLNCLDATFRPTNTKAKNAHWQLRSKANIQEQDQGAKSRARSGQGECKGSRSSQAKYCVFCSGIITMISNAWQQLWRSPNQTANTGRLKKCQGPCSAECK